MARTLPLAVLEDGQIKASADRTPEAEQRRRLVAAFDQLGPRARIALLRFAEHLAREEDGAHDQEDPR